MPRWLWVCVVLAVGMGLLADAGGSGAEPVAVSSAYDILAGFDELNTPSAYDKVGVRRFEAEGVAPRAVLVLLPGFVAGANLFASFATHIVRGTEGRVIVWAVDRRTFTLEDRRGMERAVAANDPKAAYAYYFQGEPAGFTERKQADLAHLRHWGVATTLQDVRAVVRAVRARHPQARVFLGGHSMGGTLAQLYAAWDFDGTPGFREIDGLILLDGGGRGDVWTREQGIRQYYDNMQAVNRGQYYWDDEARGAAPGFLRLAEIGALAALLPDWREQPSFLAPLVPALLPLPEGVTVTNLAAFGLATDRDTSRVPYFQANCGALDPRPRGTDDATGKTLLGWGSHTQAGEPTDALAIAAALREDGGTNGLEWYSARALNAEVDLSANLDSRADLTAGLASLHGLRAYHAAATSVPIFACAVGQSEGSTGRMEWYRGKVASSDFTLVSVPNYAHLDPLFADHTTGQNRCLAALIPWLAAHAPPQE